MPRKLVVAGIVIMGVGLALLGYLDPVIRIIFFGQTGFGTSGGSALSRTSFSGTFAGGNFTGAPSGFGRAAGTTSLISVATIVVFVAIVVGLLLTVAGSFTVGRPIPTGAGPGPAAKQTIPEQPVNLAELDKLAQP